jgi:glycosyltransferase involved in cell wall biosynthesis
VRRFVKTAHGRPEPWAGVDRLKMALYTGLDAFMTRLATDRIVAVSADLRTELISRLPASRVALIRNGIDPHEIRITTPRPIVRETLGLPADAPIFGSVGRLMPVKGLTYFLSSAPRTLEELPAARFLIVGEGPLRPELEERTRALGIETAVRFLGFRRDVIDLLNAIDVFVLPSLSEGLPMALLEAMALGKLIVASAVGGIPEVLHGEHAWLVPPRDPRALTEACLRAHAACTKPPDAAARKAREDQMIRAASNMIRDTRVLYEELTGRQGIGSAGGR